MKRKLAMVLAAIFLIGGAVHAGAATREETRLERGAGDIDRDAEQPDMEKPVVKRIESEFKVTDARINSLRNQKLGYGEITIVLALAKKMPGGITDANIDKIMSMRNGPPKMGWGEIAHKLGFKLGPVISRVEKVRKEERHEMSERREMKEKTDKRMGERPEHPGRPEKPDMPGRGGR